MADIRSDADLIAACLDKNERAKSENAWKQLVDRYTQLVYAIALRQGLCKPDADDVFQNVFVIVYRRLETLRNQDLIAAWIIRITYRECYRLHRRSPESLEIPETLPDSRDLAEDQVQAWEQRHLVRLALEQIGSPCRELLHALFLEAPTPNYDEIARRLGIAVGSIGPTRARCFKKLETLMVELGVRP